MNLIDFIRKRKTKVAPLPAGMHTFRSGPDEPDFRLHLSELPVRGPRVCRFHRAFLGYSI